MNKADLIAIRGPQPGDKNFILATWMKGLKYGNDLFGLIDTGVYFTAYQTVIEAILDSPQTLVRIACLKDEPEVILGYSVLNLEQNAAHFCFVKAAWRSIGIARSLVPETTTTFTHLTKAGEAILKKKKLKYNPFII